MPIDAPENPAHERLQFGLIRWGCSCGWRFRIDELKGKTDEALQAEGEAAFAAHVAEIER